MNKSFVREEVEKLYPEMLKIRRHIHQNPELSEQEKETQAFLMQKLDEAGIEYYQCADTGLVAIVHGEKSGKVIAIRADIDALPVLENADEDFPSCNEGVMHACGHDAHTTIALATALFFQQHRDQFSGAVKFFFQPAEETVGGAKRMVREGCLKNPQVDACIGLHVTPKLRYDQVEVQYGCCNASTDSFEIIVHGKGAHGARPNEGIDAILISAEIITALQSIISRTFSPLEPSVLTIGSIHGGSAGNVIADEVRLKGTFRASNREMRVKGLERMKSICAMIAEAMEGSCEIHFDPDAYDPLINYDEIVDVIKEEATDYLGAEHVIQQDCMSMGGEDFSFFIEDVPGAFYQLGCQKKGSEAFGLHVAGFALDERCLMTGCAIHIMTVLKLLQ